MAKYKYFHELCPHCGHENKLPNTFEIHKCKCGKDLLPCAICTHDSCNDCNFDIKNKSKTI